MTDQVYYSIDREPGICAQLIAQGIRAGQSKKEKRPNDEEIRWAAEQISKTFDKLMAATFWGIRL